MWVTTLCVWISHGNRHREGSNTEMLASGDQLQHGGSPCKEICLHLEHLTQKKSSTNVEVRTGHRARGFTPRPPVQQGSSFLAPHLSLGKLRLQAGSTLGGANSHREEKGLWTFEDLYISSDTPSCPINSSRVLGWEGVGRKPVPPAVSLGKTVAWRLGSLWTAAEMLLLAAAGRAISPLPHLPLLLQ